jgi:hypothetical protein
VLTKTKIEEVFDTADQAHAYALGLNQSAYPPCVVTTKGFYTLEGERKYRVEAEYYTGTVFGQGIAWFQ